jgi:hypothetical protein
MFVEIIQNVVDPAGAIHAALSHASGEHFHEFFHENSSAFDEACNHAQIFQHGRIDRHSMDGFRRDWNAFVERSLCLHAGLISRIGKKGPTCGLLDQLAVSRWARIRQAPLGVEKSFLGLSSFAFVAPLRTIVGELSAVMLLAAERAAQIPTSPVSGVGQKEYPTMFASRQVPSNMWLSPQSQPQ